MRAQSFFHAAILFGGAMLALPVFAEEKNGLMVNVSKKTLDRVETAASARTDKTQALGVMVKNTSIKDLPEGEVKWTIVVRKAGEVAPYKYSGSEVLKPLRSSASTELVLGAAQTTGYRYYYGNYRDKLEYEIIINHAGKETFRLSSDNNFAALAKRAMQAPGEEIVAPAPVATPPAPPATKPIDAKPLVPVLPLAPMTPATPLAPPPPVTPVPAAPAVPPNPSPTPEPEGQPFDFFNLDRKK